MIKDTNFSYVTCNKCGWVHFSVTRSHAEKEVAAFNIYYDSLSVEDQQQYYGGNRSTINRYESCGLCANPHTNFRPAADDDCPIGVTIGPIISEYK